MQDKNHTIILIDTEKAFEKIKHSFIVRNINRLDIEEDMYQHNRGQI